MRSTFDSMCPRVITNMFKKLIKVDLKVDGMPFDPVSAFTRFACWRNGGRSPLAVLRTILAASLGLTLMIDYGFVDWLTRRSPDVDDPLWFWFRPIDVICLLVFIMLVLGVSVSFIKRKDDSPHIVPYLILWNLRINVIPLCATAFILYNGDIRWRTSKDALFEASLALAFTACCIELIVVGVPVSPYDVVPSMIHGLGFITYTALVTRVFGMVEFEQLDWHDPNKAMGNATLFMLILLACAVMCFLIGNRLNKLYGIHQEGKAHPDSMEIAPMIHSRV